MIQWKVIALALVALLGATMVGTAAAHKVVKIKGTNGDDVITGTPSNDVIWAKRGNDQVSGLGGNDRVIAGPGDDTVSGGDGDDRLRGRTGDDRLDGEAGDDRLAAGAGADVLSGGDGDDVLFMLADDGQLDTADCGPGHDTVWINSAETDAHANCERVATVTFSGPPAAADEEKDEE